MILEDSLDDLTIVYISVRCQDAQIITQKATPREAYGISFRNPGSNEGSLVVGF